MKSYFVYIATNRSESLYIGITNNLERRMAEHANGQIAGFTSKYNIDTLIYYEETSDVRAAIQREKQLKGWSRAKKKALIAKTNPEWLDLINNPDGRIDPSTYAQDDRIEQK